MKKIFAVKRHVQELQVTITITAFERSDISRVTLEYNIVLVIMNNYAHSDFHSILYSILLLPN